MIISANGIVINEYGDVLLVQRDDTRTLAPPGGACEIGELPPQAAAREVREETGVIVHPIRLVGLYYLSTRPDVFLFMCFRCMPRGGELATSAETLSAGYYATNPLGGRILAAHKEQVERAFSHRGGPPYWGEHELSPLLRAGTILLNRLIYPWFRIRRKLSGQPAYIQPPRWQVKTIVIISDDQDNILCLRDTAEDTWQLPCSYESDTEAPWNLAIQVIEKLAGIETEVRDISGIYLKQDEPQMIFVFKATAENSSPPSSNSTAFVAPDVVLKQLTTNQHTMLADAIDSDEMVSFKVLT